MEEPKTVDLCTSPSMAVQSEIEIVDLNTPSTTDLSTPRTVILGQSMPGDEPNNSTDASSVRLTLT